MARPIRFIEMQSVDYQCIMKSLIFANFSLARPIGGPERQQQGDIQYFSSIFFYSLDSHRPALPGGLPVSPSVSHRHPSPRIRHLWFMPVVPVFTRSAPDFLPRAVVSQGRACGLMPSRGDGRGPIFLKTTTFRYCGFCKIPLSLQP